MSARLLRGMLAAQRTSVPVGPCAHLAAEWVERAMSLQPSTASMIRKAVQRGFSQHFGAGLENQAGGSWMYLGQCAGRPLSILVDCGGQVERRAPSIRCPT